MVRIFIREPEPVDTIEPVDKTHSACRQRPFEFHHPDNMDKLQETPDPEELPEVEELPEIE